MVIHGMEKARRKEEGCELGDIPCNGLILEMFVVYDDMQNPARGDISVSIEQRASTRSIAGCGRVSIQHTTTPHQMRMAGVLHACMAS